MGHAFWAARHVGPSVPGAGISTTAIAYNYDALYRLTGASYSSGQVFTYTYDAVGNRLGDGGPTGATAYAYDTANRLTTINGTINYTWDNNGNLIDNGQGVTYTYDAANRLVAVSGSTFTYSYDGLDNRLRQTASGVPITDTNDLSGGLTQVLVETSNTGATTYLYGLNRIEQQSPASADYFLDDGLGSVRQLADASGDVTLEKNYEPFGRTLSTTGGGSTTYGFAGEYQDPTALYFLRARYYASQRGRFIQADNWEGEYANPQSLDRWAYADGNPTNRTDPSGRCQGSNCPPPTSTPPPPQVPPPSTTPPPPWQAPPPIVYDPCFDHPEIPCRCKPPVYPPNPLAFAPGAGYLEGVSANAGLVEGGIWGHEIVYDFATMTRSQFAYGGRIVGATVGIGTAAYVSDFGGFTWNSNAGNTQIWDDYSNDFEGVYVGVGFGQTTAGEGFFHSLDWKIAGPFSYVSLGSPSPLPGEGVEFETTYYPVGGITRYAGDDGKVNVRQLANDILTGDQSPLSVAAYASPVFGGARIAAAARLVIEASLYEETWQALHSQ